MLSTDALLNSPGFQSVPASSVWEQQSWSAPNSTQFAAFAYTSASFDSGNGDETGGLSVGFKGSGGSAPTDLNFPWTQDCSITEYGSPRQWVGNGEAVGLDPAVNACDTYGRTDGWNYDNSEVESTSPGTDPESPYQTLTLSIWCARDAACDETDTASTDVTNLSGQITDPYDQPSGGGSWSTPINPDDWYQTDSNAPVFSASASDPGGVCAMGVYFNGPSSYYDQVTDDSPGMEDPGSPIGTEFDSIEPCGGGSASSNATMSSNIASGTYGVAVVASNPGNWESGAGLSNAPAIASYSDAVNIDDTTPTASWVDPPSSWTASTSEVLDVTVGPSGLVSLSCTDNGSNVAPTLTAGSSAGGGTTAWTVPTATNGANDITCSASDGDANGALVGTISGTFHVDTVVPVVRFADSGYAGGTWTNLSQTVTVTTTGGPSGIKTFACAVDGSGVQMTSSEQVTINGNGRHVLDCTATSNTNVTGSSSYDVNIDTEQPTLTFLVNGAAPGSAWLSGTPVVTVVGSESGGILSGLEQVDCSVNGGSSFSLSGIDSANDYTSSFELQQNGSNQVSCTGTTVAGTTQSAPSTMTVNVDNPNYSPNPSDLIDDGNNPFSGGPSQSQWYMDAAVGDHHRR